VSKLLTNSLKLSAYIIIPLYFLGLVSIAYLLPREEFLFNLFSFFLCFGIYLVIYQKVKNDHLSLKLGIVLAVTARIILLFAFPSLSDDYYRFLFDGHLLLDGINPYTQIPEDWVKDQALVSGSYMYSLYEGMNSLRYYSVYPPLHQVIFGIAAFSGDSLLNNLLVLRTIIIAFDLLNIYLLYQLLKLWGMPSPRILLYALNPLVILELTGNLHFEGMVLTGLLAALYFFEKQRQSLLSASWAWAVGIKLIPLMFGPLFLRRAIQLRFPLSFLAWSGIFLLCALGFLYFDKSYLNFWQSIQLYAYSFEFNASIYYLIRWVSGFFMDYNPIVYVGPFLNQLAVLLILLLSIFFRIKNGKDLVRAMVWIYLAYLLLQTVVHPWYLIPAFGLSVLTSNRLFLVWTGLVFLSYRAYVEATVIESSFLLILQYGLLFFSLYLELKKLNQRRLI
jgi:alpha-1,6-mannosyltransferase